MAIRHRHWSSPAFFVYEAAGDAGDELALTDRQATERYGGGAADGDGDVAIAAAAVLSRGRAELRYCRRGRELNEEFSAPSLIGKIKGGLSCMGEAAGCDTLGFSLRFLVGGTKYSCVHNRQAAAAVWVSRPLFLQAGQSVELADAPRRFLHVLDGRARVRGEPFDAYHELELWPGACPVVAETAAALLAVTREG